jgi:predicted metal-binding protein
MLKQVSSGAAVVACNACRHSAEAREDGAGRRGGALLAEALKQVQAADPAYADVAVQEMPCLWACSDFCTVHLRAPGKIGYVLGRFAPTEESARAILDYARAYAASAHGQVPFREWPEGVKGHFITRMPPPDMVVE